MDYAKESLKMHYDLKGKIEVVSRAKVDSKDALSLAYTPGLQNRYQGQMPDHPNCDQQFSQHFRGTLPEDISCKSCSRIR